jgi:hypothetical protein
MESFLTWLSRYTGYTVDYSTRFASLNWQLFDDAVALDWLHKNYGISPETYDQDLWFDTVGEMIDWIELNK